MTIILHIKRKGKKPMKRKIIFGILTILLILCLASALADLNGSRTYGFFSYKLKGNGTATITDFNWEANGTEDIYIPSMIDGYVVNAIGDEAFADDYFNGNVIDYKKQKKEPAKIYLPDSITTIGERAFWGSNIKMINLPMNVSFIGDGAFGCCFALNNVNVAANNATFATIDGALYNKLQKELIFWPLIDVQGKCVIYNNCIAVNVEIPSGIKSIGKYVFYLPTGWPRYKFYADITLPATISHIDDYAFYGLRIRKLSFDGKPNILIGDYSFAYTEFNNFNCNEFIIPEVNNCGIGCFEGVKMTANAGRPQLTFINLPSISAHMFEDANNGIIKINGTPEIIGEYAFSNCCSRVSMDASKCNSIGDNAFYNYNSNSEYGYDKYSINAKVINKDTFKNAHCGMLTFGGNIEEIRSGAFADCTVNEYTIPVSVKKIAMDAFDIKDDVLYVEPDSYAETWAIENGITYKYTGGGDLDWLLN